MLFELLVHSTAFLVPVEEDSKDVILDIQAPDCEKQDSRLKHQTLVVSKGMYWLPQYF